MYEEILEQLKANYNTQEEWDKVVKDNPDKDFDSMLGAEKLEYGLTEVLTPEILKQLEASAAEITANTPAD